MPAEVRIRYDHQMFVIQTHNVLFMFRQVANLQHCSINSKYCARKHLRNRYVCKINCFAVLMSGKDPSLYVHESKSTS